ncbi:MULTISPECIES: serine hydrolase [unclassified Bosea (in: a-proteobacteria)]|uniref:serine hydrolase domain-containing protein n=1 Tax=unclassified Bosea (in: a-proteobacteria) TaxID=2653178 RepID=UPI00095450A9|nr:MULTISPECIES: serine hydrolase [unclassified Bosea (in: a-proteobacteria)]TAJ34624.1 MAG: class C beta-lactamase-related serine hydrolase [Bosea sp. (in: a-proteobacteria)]SIQ27981.1 CubicO group peptidase, beta-lactamase class C family [Bosea sp. TND4EK4]
MSMIDPTRRRLFALAAFSWLGAASALHARGSAGSSAAASLADEQFRDEALAALIVMRDGQRLASLGNERLKIDVASVRKSLLGALHGIAIAEKRIDPSATLAQLGIDDLPPALTEPEKQATVRDLLGARSGVYHVSAHETADMREKRPARGSHAPGTFWFYNNWDFNALGTIYRRQTGEDIFASFAHRIARPIGMVDFEADDGRYVRVPQSRHEAYPFKLTAGDALRFGQLILDRGNWGGRQIIPSDWVAQSLSAHSTTDRGDLGYGYLWWTLPAARFGPGAAFAAGFGGQFIAVVPAHRLVVVQLAQRPSARPGRTKRFVRFLAGLVEPA